MSKKSKRGRPLKKPADERLHKQRGEKYLFLMIMGARWVSENHRKFKNSAGREKPKAEAERLRDKAREDVKRAKGCSSNKDALDKCYSRYLTAASKLSIARADAIELMVQSGDQGYGELIADFVLELLMEGALMWKKERPKSWRKEFIRNLPDHYLSLLKDVKADRKRRDESDVVAAGAKTKREDNYRLFEDQVRFVELNTKPKPSGNSSFTLAKALGQYLKDWTGCTVSDRTIERRLTAFGLADKK